MACSPGMPCFCMQVARSIISGRAADPKGNQWPSIVQSQSPNHFIKIDCNPSQMLPETSGQEPTIAKRPSLSATAATSLSSTDSTEAPQAKSVRADRARATLKPGHATHSAVSTPACWISTRVLCLKCRHRDICDDKQDLGEKGKVPKVKWERNDWLVANVIPVVSICLLEAPEWQGWGCPTRKSGRLAQLAKPHAAPERSPAPALQCFLGLNLSHLHTITKAA